MNANHYLKRLGIEKIEADFESLKLLQKYHMNVIPFENLDISRGKSIPLDLNKMYQKIIETHRGGLCFELNPLFHWLLNQLGFEARMVTGTVAINEKKWGKENTHLTTLVNLDGITYLTDVGFGNSSLTPLPLTGETIHDESGFYRVIHDEHDRYMLQKEIDGKWSTQLQFTTSPRTFSFYQPLSDFIQTNPDSPFTNGPFITIATKNGRITLTADSLVRTYKEKKTVIDVKDHEWNNLYEENFGKTQ
ncbi:MAG: arylamine N-acetyltransferase [Anaerobacillus sp.]